MACTRPAQGQRRPVTELEQPKPTGYPPGVVDQIIMDRNAVGRSPKSDNQIGVIRLQKNIACRNAGRHLDGGDAGIQCHLAIATAEDVTAAAAAGQNALDLRLAPAHVIGKGDRPQWPSEIAELSLYGYGLAGEIVGDDEDVAFGIVGFDVGELVTVVDREARRCRALPNQEAVPVQPFLL